MTNTLRYGMRASSIRYWQNEAKTLWVYNGIVRGISTFDPLNLYIANSRKIGHDIIAVAAILSPEKLKALLSEY